MTEEQIMANLGRALLQFEVAQARLNEAKMAVNSFLEKKVEPKVDNA